MNYILKRNLSKLRRLLRVESERRKYKWSGKCCLLSRYIHSDIWEYGTERRKVEEIILLLEKARAGIDKLLKRNQYTEEERRTMGIYFRNIGLRVANLRDNRLKNKRSNVIPNDDLIDVNLMKTG